MVTILQVFFVLLMIVLIILAVFRPKAAVPFVLPDNYQDLLHRYVRFYTDLDEGGRKAFEVRLEKFLAAVKITGANAEVEDLDTVLIGAAAVIPVFYIPDWEYVNLREVLLYPGHFNKEFEQEGHSRNIAGMVGTGSMDSVMILSKWEVRQGFINRQSVRNTAIHEFVHLVDKMDGTIDGVPELLLERRYVPQWKEWLERTMQDILSGRSDMDPYAATGPVECFAVAAEYFFSQPELFRTTHPEMHHLLQRIFIRRQPA